MERRPPGPYRATELWNEITRYFRAGMPLRTHRQHFRKHGSCFTASEAVDWLHEALRSSSSFGPDVSRQQTVQLLRKFLKNHVIEDVKGRWGSENLEDNGALYRFPSTSPVKPLSSSRRQNENLETFSRDRFLKLPHLSRRTPKKQLLTSLENVEKTKLDKATGNKEDALCRKEVSQEYVQETWRNIIILHLQTILGLPSLEEVLQPTQIVPEYVMYNMTHTSKHGVVILQNKSGPRSNDMSQPTYSGFERDVFRTVADYFVNLPEPLLTFEYYELFVNILVMCGFITIPNICSGKHSVRDEAREQQSSKLLHLNSFKSTECLLLSLLRKEPKGEKEECEASWKSSSEELAVQRKKLQQCELTNLLQPHLERIAVEALQICCLLLPPPNRRRIQLLMRMISRISENIDMPRLHPAVGTRSLMIQTFSRCVLCCAEEVDLDELLSTRLVSFLMDHQQEIFKVPTYLQVAVQDHIEYVKMAQCKYPGEEICAILPTYSYCERITPQEFEEQRVSTSQAAVAELLENIIKDKNLSVKEKKKKLKQFQKEYPLIYQNRFPTTENEAVLFENKPTIKQPMLSIRKPKLRSLRS
ncbi:UNVERIFIED_CONTAM: hypothetical protein H355_009060 [Colinus virginianus]|nr:hypothetical protein H355_009060 [Colinus virginianus]